MDERIIKLVALKDDILSDLGSVAMEFCVGDDEHQRAREYRETVSAGFEALEEFMALKV